jgi:CubicO group peptidase (beta-lactamase class C family)
VRVGPIAVLIAIVAAGLFPSQPAPLDLERALDDLVMRVLADHRIPGMSLAIAENGRTVYAKGFGSTSLDADRRPSPETQYRIASVSKPITAVGVFQLVQDGKVQLDRPARDYCPELAALSGAPTVRHFLMHRSGMRHTTDSEDVGITGTFPRLGAALKHIVQEPLQFTPGAKTLYTSWGYAALGCVIESAAGRLYPDFMSERVFARAGMRSTTFDRPDYASATFSPGFRRGFIYGLRPSLVVDTRFKMPASGIISTVDDLVRFVSAIFDRTLVTETSAAEMFRIEPDSGGRTMFTAGWSVDSTGLSRSGRTPYGQAFDYNGSMEGATAYLDLVPSRRYALALLANRERSVLQVQPLVADVRRLILDKAPSR